ncbi:MAG: SLC13 family permease [Planctomycetota bacterium]|jgi:di/tricarboxylate transporter
MPTGTEIALDWHSWVTGGVLLVIVLGLISGKFGADLVMLGGVAILLVTGVLTPSEALSGFANPAIGTVAVLYIVAAGLRDTGALSGITNQMLGRPQTYRIAYLRLLSPVAVASALVNNTPIVAMYLPVLSAWSKRCGLSVSRLYMPLSFATVLGGMCTLVGTSTNIVVAGLMQEHIETNPEAGWEPLEMFTFAWVGVPAAIVGLVYIFMFGPRLLRDRETSVPMSSDPKRYTTSLRINKGAPLVGKTVEQAGLRHLPGLFLSRVERESETILAVGPSQKLAEGDELVFVGDVSSVVDVMKTKGLSPVSGDGSAQGVLPRHHARLIEAVVSSSSPVLNRTLRECDFRSRYKAVVVAIHRAGERLQGKLGDIVLRSGDTLLLEAEPEFASQFQNSTEFYLVSALPGEASPRYRLASIAWLILLGMVVLMALAPDRAFVFALAAAMGMILMRCTTGPKARSSVDWQVLLVIGSSFGFAHAMEKTGLAQLIASQSLGWIGSFGPWGVLAGIYVMTAIFTSIITNNAAAALMFPIALAAATEHAMSMTPVAVCLALAASAGFATPLGYQTNLMVMGPGGYKTSDFIRFGAPLTILIGLVVVLIAPRIYGM